MYDCTNKFQLLATRLISRSVEPAPRFHSSSAEGKAAATSCRSWELRSQLAYSWSIHRIETYKIKSYNSKTQHLFPRPSGRGREHRAPGTGRKPCAIVRAHGTAEIKNTKRFTGGNVKVPPVGLDSERACSRDGKDRRKHRCRNYFNSIFNTCHVKLSLERNSGRVW